MSIFQPLPPGFSLTEEDRETIHRIVSIEVEPEFKGRVGPPYPFRLVQFDRFTGCSCIMCHHPFEDNEALVALRLPDLAPNETPWERLVCLDREACQFRASVRTEVPK